MIEWNELSKTDWKGILPELGKKMQSWVSEDTRNALHRSFRDGSNEGNTFEPSPFFCLIYLPKAAMRVFE